MGQIGTKLSHELERLAFQANNSRGNGMSEIGKMFDAVQKSISELEDKLDAVAGHPAREG